MSLRIALVVSIVSMSSVAVADEWSASQEHKYSQGASIRVVEPEGYKVTVGDATDTVPAVFNLANKDAYVVVKFASPEGRSWEKKIEVRANNQTIVRVKHTPPTTDDKGEPAKKKMYIGTVRNSTNKCDKRSNHKFEFTLDTDVVASFELKAGQYQPNVKLAPGNYDVRRYSVVQGQWVFTETTPFSISKDGWVYYYGCE